MSANYEQLNLSSNFQYILRHYDSVGERVDSSSEVYKHLCSELRNQIETVIDNSDDYLVNASMGMTNKADCPWIAIMNRSITTTTQKGLYVAFIFKKDMSGFYLTLMQGMENYKRLYGKKQYDNARKVADYFVSQISDTSFSYEPMDLGAKKGSRGYGYGKGTIIEKYYAKNLFNDKILIMDIQEIMSVYEAIAKHMDTASYDGVIRSVLADDDIGLIKADDAIEMIKNVVDPDDEMPFGFHREITEVIPRVDRSEKFKRITQPKVGKIDYISKAKRDSEAGLLGEKLVLEYEKERLIKKGLGVYAEKVVWASQESDRFGYDICSFDQDENGEIKEIKIEVKTTTSKVDTEFFVSKNELETSKQFGSSYCVYRLYDVRGNKPKFYRAFGPIDANFFLDPVTYMARYKEPEIV